MDDSDEARRNDWPVFSTEQTPHGQAQHIVHWRGRKWGMLTPILVNDFERVPYGVYERRQNTTAELSFKLLLLDEVDAQSPI